MLDKTTKKQKKREDFMENPLDGTCTKKDPTDITTHWQSCGAFFHFF